VIKCSKDSVQTPLLSVKELSEWIGIKPKTIYDWANSERIPNKKIGSRVLFSPDEVQSWLDTLQRGTKLRQKDEMETTSETKR
jgi:excisionase family DNA binding protein